MSAVRLRMMMLAAVLGLAGGLSGLPAAAQSVEDSVVAQLRQQGYVEFNVSYTLLGRLHIVALSAEYRREIVINPNNGEILRDYITALAGASGGPLIVIPDRRLDDDDSGGNGGNDDDDDDSGGGTDTGGGGTDTGGGGTDTGGGNGNTGGGDDDDDDDDGGDDDDDDDDGDD